MLMGQNAFLDEEGRQFGDSEDLERKKQAQAKVMEEYDSKQENHR